MYFQLKPLTSSGAVPESGFRILNTLELKVRASYTLRFRTADRRRTRQVLSWISYDPNQACNPHDIPIEIERRSSAKVHRSVCP